jgi:hypothetical protein
MDAANASQSAAVAGGPTVTEPELLPEDDEVDPEEDEVDPEEEEDVDEEVEGGGSVFDTSPLEELAFGSGTGSVPPEQATRPSPTRTKEAKAKGRRGIMGPRALHVACPDESRPSTRLFARRRDRAWTPGVCLHDHHVRVYVRAARVSTRVVRRVAPSSSIVVGTS